MTCPHCGAVVSGLAGTCSACRRRLDTAPASVTGLVTGFGAVTTGSSSIDATAESETLAGSPLPKNLHRVVSEQGLHGPLGPGEAFGSRYHIIRLLGIGGMGAVYQAFDAELGMAVALKVIRPEASADPEAAREMQQRFKQELVLARKVTHKNVVRIHDLGEIGGIKYITMPYLEGADLAGLLQRSGKLSLPAALRIVRDVAAGLVAAHEAGIVHRDLKPANIMVAEDRAIIMDFGIARLSAAFTAGQLAEATSPETVARANAAMTTVGAIVGTLDYMAPEQARGEAVDQRADIYALGLMFSDMLVGRPAPPDGVTDPLAALKWRMENAPRSVRSTDPTIPEAIDRLITRCVQPDPAARFPTSAALVAELDKLDERGQPLPIKRVVGMRAATGAVVVFLLLIAGTWWFARTPAPPVQPEPVSVVVADFRNNTGDPTLDRTLEPVMKRALEDAGFIRAFARTDMGALGERPRDVFDEAAASEVAVKQGLGVVFAGTLDRQGSGYGISIKAVQTVSGETVADVKGRAPDKDRILSVTTGLVTSVRRALGDDTSDDRQMFAMASLSAPSLEVVRLYALSQDAMSNARFEEARQHLLAAVALDPKFGIGYQNLAVASRNLRNLQDAQKYINEALRFLDGMTERERYSTRGMFYRLNSDYPKCVQEYGELITRFSADVMARNQLALCSSNLRDLRRAVDEMTKVVQILPNRTLFRDNLALYSNYAGDFQAAEQHALKVTGPDVYAMLAVAFSKLGQGQPLHAMETYRKMEAVNAQGASVAASGLGDLASYEGRFVDAARILEEGAAREAAAKSLDSAATKYVALANAHLSRGDARAAAAAADRAVANGSAVKIRFSAARTYVETGQLAKAQPLIKSLASELTAEPQAYAKLVEGNIARTKGDLREAIRLMTEANSLFNTWIGHFDLGRAYLEAGQFAQADSEFDACLKRRGEALSLFLDEEPTFAALPPVYYYQGRVREELKNERFADSYRAYLDIRGKSTEDPLLADIRKRVRS